MIQLCSGNCSRPNNYMSIKGQEQVTRYSHDCLGQPPPSGLGATGQGGSLGRGRNPSYVNCSFWDGESPEPLHFLKFLCLLPVIQYFSLFFHVFSTPFECLFLTMTFRLPTLNYSYSFKEKIYLLFERERYSMGRRSGQGRGR